MKYKYSETGKDEFAILLVGVVFLIILCASIFRDDTSNRPMFDDKNAYSLVENKTILSI